MKSWPRQPNRTSKRGGKNGKSVNGEDDTQETSSLLRRTKPARDLLGYADLTLDLTSHTVTRAGVPVTLTKIEFALMKRHPQAERAAILA